MELPPPRYVQSPTEDLFKLCNIDIVFKLWDSVKKCWIHYTLWNFNT